MTKTNVDQLKEKQTKENTVAYAKSLGLTFSDEITISELDTLLREYFKKDLLIELENQEKNKKEINKLISSDNLTRADLITLCDLRSRLLQRVSISCNNPELTRFQKGNVYTVSNQFLTISRYVPFVGQEALSWYLPIIIINHLKERMVMSVMLDSDTSEQSNVSDGNMASIRDYSILSPEFNIHLLPSLTKEELNILKKQQETLKLGY